PGMRGAMRARSSSAPLPPSSTVVARAAAPDGVDDDEEVDELDLPPLDDGEASDLDVGDELEELEGDKGVEGEDEVDVGPLDEGIDVAEEDRDPGEDEVGAADAEGIDVDESRDPDDGGAEGTSENPEDQVDEASLPDLDDGEDLGDEQALAQALLAEDGLDLPDWAEGRVAPVDGAGAAVPCRSIAVAG